MSILYEFQALSNLPKHELLAEFQATSHLGAPPDDVPPRHYQVMIELDKLRRKSWKSSTIDCNPINLKPEGCVLQAGHGVPVPPEHKLYVGPVKKILLGLKVHLGELMDSLGSEKSLQNLYQIDTLLDELKPFTNAIRLCQKSKTCSQDPQAFTLYRCQYMLIGYACLLNDLSRVFESLRILYRYGNVHKAEICWVRSHLNQIDERIKDCDRSNVDMVRRDWAAMISRLDRMQLEIVVRLRSLQTDGQDDNRQRNTCRGFILLTKLTRLLMNKIIRFTKKEALLRLEMDQIEHLNYRFQTVRNSFYRILTSVDQNHARSILTLTPLDCVTRCFQDTCQELELHFKSLDPDPFTREMLEWCDMFMNSFNIAKQKN